MERDEDRSTPDDSELIAAILASAPRLSDRQIDLLLGYRDLLFETNQRLNLTAVRNRTDVGLRLLLESLRLLPPLRESISRVPDARVLDLGTGGGIPGVPLAIALPDIPFVLLDATKKKLDAVSEMTDRLGLQNVMYLPGRAEEFGHDPRWREHFSTITARAVSSLPALIELGLPLLRMHGTLLLPKGMGIDEELRAGENAAKIVGGKITTALILPRSGSCIETTLVVVKKIRTTPASYPRRSGLPSRQPLGLGLESAPSR